MSYKYEEVRSGGDGHQYHVRLLWELTAGAVAEEWPLARLEALRTMPQWDGDGDRGATVSAADILAAPMRFPMQMARAAAADTRYPLLVTAGGHLLDGAHRFLRALHKGAVTVPVVTVDEDTLARARYQSRGRWTTHAARERACAAPDALYPSRTYVSGEDVTDALLATPALARPSSPEAWQAYAAVADAKAVRRLEEEEAHVVRAPGLHQRRLPPTTPVDWHPGQSPRVARTTNRQLPG